MKLRKQEEVLQVGNLELLSKPNSKLLIYERSLEGKERILVALNFSKNRITLASPYTVSKRIFSTIDFITNESLNKDFLLQPLEGVILKEVNESMKRKN